MLPQVLEYPVWPLRRLCSPPPREEDSDDEAEERYKLKVKKTLEDFPLKMAWHTHSPSSSVEKAWYNPNLLFFFPDEQDPNSRDPDMKDLFYSEVFYFFKSHNLADDFGHVPMGVFGYGQDFIFINMDVFGEDRSKFTWEVCDELQELGDLFGYVLK